MTHDSPASSLIFGGAGQASDLAMDMDQLLDLGLVMDSGMGMDSDLDRGLDGVAASEK